MRTEELIETLSLNPKRQAPVASIRIYAFAMLAAAAMVLPVALLWLRPRHDLASVLSAGNGIFLLKLTFTAAIAVIALPALQRLSTPGRRTEGLVFLVAVPFVLMFLCAAYHLAFHSSGDLWRQLSDSSWLACLIEIPVLASIPFLVMVILVRRYAPTNLFGTGGCIGLFAGGLGGLGYTFHCHDDTIPFIAIAYSAAILLTSALGALAASRLLRWK
jgi:hypothetical protein